MSVAGSSELPAGWVVVRLDDIAEVRLGRQRSPGNHTGRQMRPYLRAANVTWSGIDVADVKQMNFTDEEIPTYELRPGDILLGEASGSPDEVGKPAIWRGELPGTVCFQNTLLRVRVEPGVSPEWLRLRLLYECLSGGFVRESRGVGIHHLGAAKLSALMIELPPIEEQARIVSACEAALSSLDRAFGDLADLDRLLAALEESTLQAGLMGRLEVLPAPGTTAASSLAAALDDVPVPDTPELPGLPTGWQWTTLGALSEVVGGVTKDSKKQDDPDYVEVPYLRVANVQRGRLDLEHVARIRVPVAKAAALRLEVGDVLFNEGGDRDKLGRGWVWHGEIADCIHQNHVFRARIRGGVIDPRLLSWHGNTFGRRWFEAVGRQTTNLASLSMTNLKRLPVPVPPLEQQAAIVDAIDRRLTIVNTVRDSALTLRRRFQRLKLATLRAAAGGRLVPQVQTDTPADVVVKMVTEERHARPTAPRRRRRTMNDPSATAPEHAEESA